MIEYKGYHGQMKIDEEAGLIHGEVMGLRDVVTFQGRTVEEAQKGFMDSIDDYLECLAQSTRVYFNKGVVHVFQHLHNDLRRSVFVPGTGKGIFHVDNGDSDG